VPGRSPTRPPPAALRDSALEPAAVQKRSLACKPERERSPPASELRAPSPSSESRVGSASGRRTAVVPGAPSDVRLGIMTRNPTSASDIGVGLRVGVGYPFGIPSEEPSWQKGALRLTPAPTRTA
jgi:hypothetical protein